MRVHSKILISAIFFACSISAVASDRAEKIRSLMQAQGLVTTFEQQIALGRENCRKQADQMITQVFAGMNASPKYEAMMREATRDFVDAVQPASAESIVESWGTLYGSKFTDDELDQLLSYYTTPLAKKEVVAGREAMTQLSAQLQAAYAPRFQDATKAFVARLQSIAKECNCKK